MIMRIGRLLAVFVAAAGLGLVAAAPPASAASTRGIVSCTYQDDGMIIAVTCDGDLFEVVITCYGEEPWHSGLYRNHLYLLWRCVGGLENIEFVDHS